jgi:RNA-splicing ligase RtcB
VLIAGARGIGATVLAGLDSGEALALSSACHGAGCSLSGVEAMVLSAERAGLARRVARLEPLISIKG